MKSNKIFKIFTMSAVVITLLFLVQSNVTFSHEPRIEGATTDLNLEINSDLVQTLYSKLTLLEDSILSDKYKYAYFKMNTDEKELSPEEKLYVAIENMYSNDRFDLMKDDEIEKTTVESATLIDEAANIFKDSELNPKNMNIAVSSNCGIVSYLYTGETFELGFKKCDPKEEKSITKLSSARKQENYIVLRLKSFYANYKKSKKNSTYVAYNYNSEDMIEEFADKDIDEKLNALLDDDRIDEYDFYFELHGDDYNLTKIVSIH